MDDEAFLKQLYDEFKDDEYLLAHQTLTAIDIEQSLVRIKEQFGITDEEANRYRTLVEQVHSPSKAFRGVVVEYLNFGARKLLKPHYPKLPDIIVAQLPSRELNGFAIAAPSGNRIIILNSGVIFSIGAFVRTALCVYSWHMKDYVSREFSQGTFAAALIAVAEYVASGDVEFLKPALNTITLNSRPLYDPVYRFAHMTELFIILHEYGHVLLGHLDQSKITNSKIASFDILRLTDSQIHEYEADAFAYNILCDGLRRSGNSKAKPDAALGPGLLFKLFELCDAITGPVASDTHPLARDRWNKIARLASLHSYPESIAAHLDDLFGTVMRLRFGT